MRSLLFVLLLVCATAAAQIMPQQASNNQGSFFRLHNESPYYTNCFYRDQYNFITFTIAPYSSSMWYPVYGYYEWQCR